jgi:hypothetical protein
MLRLDLHDSPAWTRAIQWLWRQDGRNHIGKQIEDAWLQAFAEVLPPRAFYGVDIDDVPRYVENPAWCALWAAVYDGGDCEYRVTHDGRVWFCGYDGDGVGLVRGPHDLLRY